MKTVSLSAILAFCGLGGTVESQDIAWDRMTTNAPWCARDSAGELVYKGRMWLLGGWTIGEDKKFHRLNDVWSSTDGITWEETTPAATWPVRNLAGAVVFKDRMWIMGGCDGVNSLGDVWSSADGKNWTCATNSAPWGARLAFGCTVFAGKIWVVGGMDMKTMRHMNDVWNSSDGAKWTNVSDGAPWSPRAMFPLVEIGGKLWLFGGGVYDKKSENQHDVWYTTDGAHWVQATGDAGWAERRFHIITCYNDALWLFGGVTDGNVNMNDIWHSTDGVNWNIVNKSAPWGVRHEQMCYVHEGTLWMLGGFAGDVAEEYLYRDIWRMKVK